MKRLIILLVILLIVAVFSLEGCISLSGIEHYVRTGETLYEEDARYNAERKEKADKKAVENARKEIIEQKKEELTEAYRRDYMTLTLTSYNTLKDEIEAYTKFLEEHPKEYIFIYAGQLSFQDFQDHIDSLIKLIEEEIMLVKIEEKTKNGEYFSYRASMTEYEKGHIVKVIGIVSQQLSKTETIITTHSEGFSIMNIYLEDYTIDHYNPIVIISKRIFAMKDDGLELVIEFIKLEQYIGINGFMIRPRFKLI